LHRQRHEKDKQNGDFAPPGKISAAKEFSFNPQMQKQQ